MGQTCTVRHQTNWYREYYESENVTVTMHTDTPDDDFERRVYYVEPRGTAGVSVWLINGDDRKRLRDGAWPLGDAGGAAEPFLTFEVTRLIEHMQAQGWQVQTQDTHDSGGIMRTLMTTYFLARGV
jgi:hypothetical protein